MIAGAFVFPTVRFGMIEVSHTLTPSTPITRISLSTTLPIAQVPAGW